MKLSNFWIPFLIWIGILVVIGLSINQRWGDHWGYTIPLAFLALSFREILKLKSSSNPTDSLRGKDDKKDSAPRTNDVHYTITEEDIEGDLHEGRD